MLLQLRITMPETLLNLDLYKIGELFHVRYIMPGATISSDGQKSHFLQMEIDGARELSEEAYNFLREHTYHLAFLQPPHTYTKEEAQELDALDYQGEESHE